MKIQFGFGQFSPRKIVIKRKHIEDIANERNLLQLTMFTKQNKELY